MRQLDVAVLAAAIAGAVIAFSLPGDWKSSSSEQRWERVRDATKMPAPLFPEAVEVRVFGTDQYIRMPGTVSKDGGALSPGEIALLRKSVYYAPRPPSIALCCIPRHSFVFYGARHRFIGYLDVCFQCGCAHIYPSEKPNDLLTWIGWDEKALRRIVEAHHLKVRT